MMTQEKTIIWFHACSVNDVPANGGVCVKYKDEQIALFHFTRLNEWYATQYECTRMRMNTSSDKLVSDE